MLDSIKIVIKLQFVEPGAISSSSNQNDKVRILFQDTEQFIRCETVADLFNSSQVDKSDSEATRALQTYSEA